MTESELKARVEWYKKLREKDMESLKKWVTVPCSNLDQEKIREKFIESETLKIFKSNVMVNSLLHDLEAIK